MMSNNTPKNFTTPPTAKITEFYQGAHVLLTGATGFVGKAVLEKLLRTCDASGNIYLLIRPKQKLTAEERLKQLLESSVFHKLRKTRPGCFAKVKLVYADLEQENIGLSKIDRKILANDVNIVLHSAANVSFTQTLESAVRTNTIGLKQLIELCKDMKNLKSFVHVSTIFRHILEVEEIIYPTPYDPNFIVNCVKALPSDILALITPKLLGKEVNTYSFSKALNEKLVSDSATILPATIVRPSIVHSSWKEPFPGWVDSLVSFTPYTRRLNMGNIKTIVCNGKLVTDIIPVDIVANTIIAAAWHSTTYPKSTGIRVYNCATSTINQITLGQVFGTMVKYVKEYPSTKIASYPKLTLQTNKKIYGMSRFFHHLLPAYVYDAYLMMTFRKPRMVKTCKKTNEMEKIYEFGFMQQRNCHAANFVDLIETVEKTGNGKDFNVDIRKGKGFNWDSYLKDYQLGFRKHILNDDISTLNYAKTKLKRLYWTNRAVKFTSMATIVGFIWWKS